MTAVCEIPHPIIIVSARGPALPLDDRLAHSLDVVPNVDAVARVLNYMREGVPTVLKTEDSEKYGPQEVAYFCSPVYVLRCIRRDEIYLLVSLNAPEFIYRHLPNWRSVRVRPTHWRVLPSGHGLESSNCHSGYPRIRQHFQAHVASLGQRAPAQEALPPDQQAYLELLRDHIALTRQVEEDRVRNRPIVAFTRVYGTDAERVVRDVYTFELSASNPFSPNEFVWVSMEGMNPDGRHEQARLIALNERQVTLKFERQIDAAQIPCPGVMGFTFNDVQQRIQELALDALRDGTSLNPHLLDIIVNGKYEEYHVPTELEKGPLNRSQNKVLHCAQAMRDMFLVLGPPGTGKTRVITELARELAGQGQRTLVTSQNNLAVDNVLMRLQGLRVVRIGHEDRVAPDARHLLIDVQARVLQQEIAAKTDASFQALKEMAGRWKEVEVEFASLRNLPPLWSDRLSSWEEAQHAVRAIQIAVWKQHEPRLKRRIAEARQAHYRAVRATRRAERTTDLLEWTLSRRDWPLLGVLFVAFSDWLEWRVNEAHQRAESDRAAFLRLTRRYEVDVARYRTAAQESSPVLAAKERLQEEEATVRSLARAARSAVQRIHDFLKPSPVSLPEPVAATPKALSAYLDRLESLRRVLEWRSRLLAEWRELLRERRQALYLALIRSADVVGATCIGIATKKHFRDLEFDTVIVDEAGQIQVFYLLVPLVRARRAVLVGDHQQLPPIVDGDVRALLDDEDEESIDLLEQSLFERLYEAAPFTHKGMLNTQYRMPSAIADFISQFFYDGTYLTDSSQKINPLDPFVTHPVCFVDTKHRKQYRERKARGQETGYSNPGEAEILARVANAYMSQGYEVGVIVPYRLQVIEVQRALRRRRPDLDENELRNTVATVDSFQGKERDTVLFGFTRSNNWGGVGFLRELRRLNVTITRAQRQLVLVGDSVTLTQAGDLEFQKFACDLLEYVRQCGQYLEVGELKEVLSGSNR